MGGVLSFLSSEYNMIGSWHDVVDENKIVDEKNLGKH